MLAVLDVIHFRHLTELTPRTSTSTNIVSKQQAATCMLTAEERRDCPGSFVASCLSHYTWYITVQQSQQIAGFFVRGLLWRGMTGCAVSMTCCDTING